MPCRNGISARMTVRATHHRASVLYNTDSMTARQNDSEKHSSYRGI
jgi:hypothetical protein